MPSFSFTPISKPAKVKSYADSTNKYNIILADQEGIVCINLLGEYKVLIGDVQYDIATECYSCKGVTEIYEQDLTNDLVRVRHIRSERDREDRDRTMYLPFTAGCSVKGNIVRYKAAGTVIFKIKKVFVDLNDSIAKEAIKFYRNNYITIKAAIAKNWLDNHVVQTDQEVFDDMLKQEDANDK